MDLDTRAKKSNKEVKVLESGNKIVERHLTSYLIQLSTQGIKSAYLTDPGDDPYTSSHSSTGKSTK